jgi:hypothetical protein
MMNGDLEGRIAPAAAPLPQVETWPLRTKDVVARRVGGDTLLCDPATDTIHLLNPTALAVWELCDGHHSPDQITQRLAGLFAGVLAGDAARDVQAALTSLEQLGLLQHNETAMEVRSGGGLSPGIRASGPTRGVAGL